jgi:hypothetical protein
VLNPDFALPKALNIMPNFANDRAKVKFYLLGVIFLSHQLKLMAKA